MILNNVRFYQNLPYFLLVFLLKFLLHNYFPLETLLALVLYLEYQFCKGFLPLVYSKTFIKSIQPRKNIYLANNDIFQRAYIYKRDVKYIGINKQKLQMLKNFYILNRKIFFSTLAILKLIVQNISILISLSSLIINIVIVDSQFLALINLVKAQIFYIYKQIWIVMIYQHQHFIFTTF